MCALWAVGPTLPSHVVIDNVISDQVLHIDQRFDRRRDNGRGISVIRFVAGIERRPQ
ncbi:hypothetical protein [Rhizobium mongolense]|uniref:Uncharacterized protein n=1 Tax=Rhizobium mongolense TaxID=57676 RepID=A0A7W6RI98_9HYPH|nr:hypothetical protein [Rhizobium mongolense]MBB4272967.1 hypothetical protein [Rhizobium mongolense]